MRCEGRFGECASSFDVWYVRTEQMAATHLCRSCRESLTVEYRRCCMNCGLPPVTPGTSEDYFTCFECMNPACECGYSWDVHTPEGRSLIARARDPHGYEDMCKAYAPGGNEFGEWARWAYGHGMPQPFGSLADALDYAKKLREGRA